MILTMAIRRSVSLSHGVPPPRVTAARAPGLRLRPYHSTPGRGFAGAKDLRSAANASSRALRRRATAWPFSTVSAPATSAGGSSQGGSLAEGDGVIGGLDDHNRTAAGAGQLCDQ